MFFHPTAGARGARPAWLWGRAGGGPGAAPRRRSGRRFGPHSHALRYWTPARMQSARPLDLVVGRDGRPHLRLGRPAPAASASFLAVATPEAPPYSVNGRIFIRVTANAATARAPRSTARAGSWS